MIGLALIVHQEAVPFEWGGASGHIPGLRGGLSGSQATAPLPSGVNPRKLAALWPHGKPRTLLRDEHEPALGLALDVLAREEHGVILAVEPGLHLVVVVGT